MIAQIILPIVFILMAIGVYFGLTDSVINGTSFFWGTASKPGIFELQAQKNDLTKALADADALQQKADDLKKKANSLDQTKLARLDSFLPDAIDDLQLVVDINGIAGRSNMTISDVKLMTENKTGGSGATANTNKTFAEVTTVPLSFTVQGSYANLKSFLTDLSNNLRLLDVTKLDFGQNSSEDIAKGSYKYNITVETYWLK